jgi:hypothetical protein
MAYSSLGAFYSKRSLDDDSNMTIMDDGRPNHKQPKFAKQVDDPAAFTLTAEERELIREKARQQVLREMKDREEQTLLDVFLKEERQKALPEEQLSPIWMNLALHTGFIRLDDKMYLNETLYYVTPAVFAVLTEQMARGWAHEAETEVRDARTRRRAALPPMSMANYGDNRQPRELKMASSTLAAHTAALRATVVGS